MTTDNDAPAAGLVEALRDVRAAITEADPLVLTDTLWMPPRLSFNETVVDYIDAALQAPQEAGVEVADLLKSFAVYTVEEDEDAIRLSVLGQPIACWGDRSPQGKALLQLDALHRSALSQPVATPAPHGDYWHSINTAPEDEHVILATSGDHVGEALMLADQDTGEQKWTWAGAPVSKFHTPLGWRPMPSPIRFAVPDDNRSGGFDGPTGAE